MIPRPLGSTTPPGSPASEDETVVLTQMAEAYYSLTHAGVHYAAELVSQHRRDEWTIAGQREQLAEKNAQTLALETEMGRYTRSQVAGSEAA
jgi:hypothetical protein